MLKARKAPIKARLLLKSPIKRLAKVLIKEVVILRVVAASLSSYIIKLL
jgi:hypothetical protein